MNTSYKIVYYTPDTIGLRLSGEDAEVEILLTKDEARALFVDVMTGFGGIDD